MKIFFARLTMVFWVLTILLSISCLFSEISDGGGFFGGVTAGFGVFAFLSFVTAVLSFLTLGILDPRKVLMLLKDNK